MQIVIDIPQGLKIDFENENWTALTCMEMKNALMKGTPLPKGHGRLGDLDKAIREENSKLVDFETTNTRDRSYCRYARIILDNIPTIIEAESKE